uniref:Innexin n=1 Tax=Wuchereria bancrofti TaxID=6293 RepID=A0A1I8ELG8_WUCBA
MKHVILWMPSPVTFITLRNPPNICIKYYRTDFYPILSQYSLSDNQIVIRSKCNGAAYSSHLARSNCIAFCKFVHFQFWIVSLYLGGNGYDLTRALLRQQTWQSTGLFPRVTMCDFKIRVMGNVHRHTIQCVLMANMFNEKIYVALWWWLLAVITLTVVNFFYWIYTLNSVTSSHQFLIRLVTLGVSLVPQPQKEVASHFMQLFAEQFVGDTVLVLRLVAQNASELVASSIAARLFDIFVKKR